MAKLFVSIAGEIAGYLQKRLRNVRNRRICKKSRNSVCGWNERKRLIERTVLDKLIVLSFH